MLRVIKTVTGFGQCDGAARTASPQARLGLLRRSDRTLGTDRPPSWYGSARLRAPFGGGARGGRDGWRLTASFSPAAALPASRSSSPVPSPA